MMRSKRVALFLRILIILAAYGFIAWKLNQVSTRWQETGMEGFVPNPFMVALVVGLMPFNWLLEAVRWKMLTGKIQNLSLWRSLLSVMAGIAMGILTPRRIGDVGGRCLMMNPGTRSKGLLAFALGSMLQTAVTSFFGLLALAAMMKGPHGLPRDQQLLLLAGAITALSLLALWSFNLKAFASLLLRIPPVKKFRGTLTYFHEMKATRTLKVFLLGMGRYMLFASQFFLLTRAFGSSLPMMQAYTGIALTYFLMTFVPLSSLAGLGIRGSTAVFVFGLFTPQTGGILLATLTLWLINLALPALPGAWIIGQATQWQWKITPAPAASKSYKSL